MDNKRRKSVGLSEKSEINVFCFCADATLWNMSITPKQIVHTPFRSSFGLATCTKTIENLIKTSNDSLLVAVAQFSQWFRLYRFYSNKIRSMRINYLFISTFSISHRDNRISSVTQRTFNIREMKLRQSRRHLKGLFIYSNKKTAMKTISINR